MATTSYQISQYWRSNLNEISAKEAVRNLLVQSLMPQEFDLHSFFEEKWPNTINTKQIRTQFPDWSPSHIGTLLGNLKKYGLIELGEKEGKLKSWIIKY